MVARQASGGGPNIRWRFNWRLALIILSVPLVLGGGLRTFRHYWRYYRARLGLVSGNKAFQDREWLTAAQNLGRYISVYREDTAALLKYAEAHLRISPRQRGNIDQAVAIYRQVLRRDPAHQHAALRVSQVYLDVDMPEEAQMILTRRLQADAGDTMALLLRARARRDVRDWKGAAADLRAVIDAAPGAIEAYALLADLMRERPAEVPGDPLKDVIRMAVERNPRSARAHILLGSALDQLDSPGARQEAEAEHQKALQCDLSAPQDRVVLARWRLAAGDLLEAEAHLEAAAGGPEPHWLPIWTTWADLVRLKGAPDQAGRLADRALAALGPERFAFLPTAIELYLMANTPTATDIGKADKCLQEFREKVPASRLVPWLDGQMALARGQAATAVERFRVAADAAETLRKEIGFKPVPPDLERDLVRVPMALAWAHVQANDLPAAIDVLKKLTARNPNVPAALLRLAVVYERARQNDLALDAYRRVYERDPSSRLGLALYVGALRRMEKPEEAERIIDEAAQRRPGLAAFKLEDELRGGRLDAAIDTVSDMLRLDPGNTALKVFQASLLMRGGRLDEARALLQGLDEKADLNVALASIDLLMYENKPAEALPRCDALVEREPKNVAARLMRARVREKAAQWDLALEDHRALFEIKPEALQSWMLLADFFIRHGNHLIRRGDYPAARAKYHEALNAVESCLKKDPQYAPAVAAARRFREGGISLVFARDLLARGTRDATREASLVLNDLTHQRPDWAEAWYMAAGAALTAGDTDAALKAVQSGLRPDLPLPQRRAFLLMKVNAEMLSDPALAVATLQALRAQDPSDATLNLSLARALREAGRAHEAKPILDDLLDTAQRAAKAAPDDPRPVVGTVEVLALSGRFAEAQAAVADWSGRHPKDVGTPLVTAQMLLAGGAELQGRPAPEDQKAGQEAVKAARTILEAALKTHPQNATIKVQVASACQVSRDLDQAERLYREILVEMPGHLVAINNLAWLLSEERNKPAEALELCQRAADRQPPFVALLDTRGVILRRLGRLDDARKALEECIRLAPPLGATGPMARFHLAQVLADQGQKEAARTVLTELLARPARAGGLPAKERAEAEALLPSLTG